jgi:hypothetical protein
MLNITTKTRRQEGARRKAIDHLTAEFAESAEKNISTDFLFALGVLCG